MSCYNTLKSRVVLAMNMSLTFLCAAVTVQVHGNKHHPPHHACMGATPNSVRTKCPYANRHVFCLRLRSCNRFLFCSHRGRHGGSGLFFCKECPNAGDQNGSRGPISSNLWPGDISTFDCCSHFLFNPPLSFRPDSEFALMQTQHGGTMPLDDSSDQYFGCKTSAVEYEPHIA